MEFHLRKETPNANWPRGAWSLYQITGEQIAERIRWERQNGKHVIVERWPWFGYVGMFETFEQVMAKIKELST